MRGPKEGKGDRSCTHHTGANGGGASSSVVETGALFPRLHVKETKRVGPRAPPRNKMALYEQFTFPSHRYTPPSLPLPASWRPAAAAATPTRNITTPYPPQLSSLEGSMSHGLTPVSWGMPMPYSEAYAGYNFAGQPSANGSSNSRTVDLDGDGQGPVVPSRPSSSGTVYESLWVSSQSDVSSISSKKARCNNDRTVPTYNPQLESLHGAPMSTIGSGQFTSQGEYQHRVETASIRQPMSVSSDCHVESLDTTMTSRGAFTSDERRNDEVNGFEGSRKVGTLKDGDNQILEQRESTGVRKEKDSNRMQGNYVDISERLGGFKQYGSYRHQQQKIAQADTASEVECTKGSARGSAECSTVVEINKTYDSQPSKITQKGWKTPMRSETSEFPIMNTAEQDASKRENREGHVSVGPPELKTQVDQSECKSNSSSGNGNDLEDINGAEASEASRSDEGQSGRADDDADATSAPESEDRGVPSGVLPKDISKAIGEEEFWNARELLLRQQKIFSTQLFELHRIIKVQQLLASLPAPLITGGILAMAGESLAEKLQPIEAIYSEDAHEKPQDTKACVGDQEPEDVTCKQPDSTCHSSTSDKVCDKPPVEESQSGQWEAEKVPTMAYGAPGASAASWGGPPFVKAGANNWFGAMPTPNGAFMYQPYPGSFHPSTVNSVLGYNGAYHPVMFAPTGMELPPMTPYGFPRYEQQPNMVEDMYRYNAYQQQQWQNAVFCPPVSSTPGPSWCGLPVPMTGMNPAFRGSYEWGYGDIAAGAHPSMAAGAHPSMAAGAHPSMAAGAHPSMAAGAHPSMAAGAHPSMAAGAHPSMAAGAHPSMAAGAYPSMAAGTHPSMAAGVHPSMAASAHPSMAAGAHPSNYARPPHQNSAQPIPAFQSSSFVIPSPWTDSSKGQQAVCEGERFQQQAQWPTPSKNEQQGAPVFQKPLSNPFGGDGAHVMSRKEAGGSFGACETSALTFQKPQQNSTSPDCEASVSQQAESGDNCGWRHSKGSHSRDYFGIPVECPTALQHPHAEKSENLLKRSRSGNVHETDYMGDRNGVRQTGDSTKFPGRQMNALPLFPMGPALNRMDNGRPGPRASSGVIKAVPRAMVATAESTAEILLSIQNSRQQ